MTKFTDSKEIYDCQKNIGIGEFTQSNTEDDLQSDIDDDSQL